MSDQSVLARLSAVVPELVGASRDTDSLVEAIGRVARDRLRMTGCRVVEEPGPQSLILAPGFWLEPGTGEADSTLTAFALLAGALLQQVQRQEAVAADYSAVLSRLEQLHRDLDSAQRSEWVASERSRIAQDLHDRVAQTLFGVGLKADWLLTHLERDEHLRSDLEQVKQLAATGMRQVREAIFSLSSGLVDSAQLKPAVQGMLNELKGSGISGDLKTYGDLTLLPSEVTEALFQVIREALVNVRRHSGASTVLVSIRARSERVTTVIQDDGIGLPSGVPETFRDSGAHLGLRGMESRVTRLGGTLSLAPGDECGLVVTAVIPTKGGNPQR